MIKINSIQEKETYFASTIKGDGAYFNIKYSDGSIEFVWVKKFSNWNDDGSDWYLEYPNQLYKYEYTEEDLKPYYDEEEDETYESPFNYMYLKDGFAYEINSWQYAPFLPEQFEIEFVTNSEDEAVEYMLQNNL